MPAGVIVFLSPKPAAAPDGELKHDSKLTDAPQNASIIPDLATTRFDIRQARGIAHLQAWLAAYAHDRTDAHIVEIQHWSWTYDVPAQRWRCTADATSFCAVPSTEEVWWLRASDSHRPLRCRCDMDALTGPKPRTTSSWLENRAAEPRRPHEGNAMVAAIERFMKMVAKHNLWWEQVIVADEHDPGGIDRCQIDPSTGNGCGEQLVLATVVGQRDLEETIGWVD